MSKKKNEEERKPDLNEADDQAELEARIKEMMEPEEPKPAVKPISVTEHEDDSPATAPELPGDKKPLSIKVVDHTDTEEPAKASEAETPETDPDVLAAIEEANKQLLGETESDETAEPVTDESEAEDKPESEPDEPEKPTDETPETDEEPASEETEPEPADEEPAPEPKEKPLKHLDSLVPKTKVEETLESEKTEEAVEDIITKESDALLEAEDEKLAEAFQPEPKQTAFGRLKNFLKRKTVRRTIVLLFIAGILTAGAFPASRYLILNTAGVRSSASLTVLDDSTRQPLRGVTVSLAGQTAETDQEGRAAFSDLKLGRTELVIEKRAFAPVSRQQVIGWGSNPLADFSLTPTGSQYVFSVTDFLSGEPVAKVEAASNEAAALSNEEGEIRLTIDAADETTREVTITGNGYRQEKFELNLNQKEPLPIKLVPERKHVFISKRSGHFDVYKMDIDGRNEELVLPGTGSERDDMVLVPHPTAEAAALVSTKDNKRNGDGFLLSTLTVLNLADETSKSVVTSERVQIIDWIGSRLIYVTVKDGASGSSPDRHKLISYDYETGESKDLAASNYFNDVLVAAGKIYYAPSSTYSGSASSSFFRVEADGNDRQTILNREVWNIFRGSYDRLTLAVQQEWYELKLGETTAGKISGEPPSQTSRVYTDSPDGRRSLWTDIRDGQGVLLAYDLETKEDAVIRTQGGLKNPVRWLSDNTVIYRVNTQSETADYVLNLDGGEPKKISDVTNTSGVDRWYFY